MWGDPATVRHFGGRPFTREETWQRLLRYAGLWAMLGYGYWIARERASGRFVGEIGLADFRRRITPALGDAPECGWALAPGAQGRGLAREALTTVLAWSDDELATRTVCLIDPANARSIALAERMGYARYATAVYGHTEVELFERPVGGA